MDASSLTQDQRLLIAGALNAFSTLGDETVVSHNDLEPYRVDVCLFALRIASHTDLEPSVLAEVKELMAILENMDGANGKEETR